MYSYTHTHKKKKNSRLKNHYHEHEKQNCVLYIHSYIYINVCVCVREIWEYRLVEVMSHRVSEGSDGVVQDEQVLVLVFSKGKNQSVQNEAEVGDELGACLLLQGGEGTSTETHRGEGEGERGR